MSIRQRIIDAIAAAMAEIDEFANVADWNVVWDDEDLPALAVCDLMDRSELVGDQPTASRQINTLEIQLRIFVKSATRPAALRELISLVNAKIAANRYWNDGEANLALWTRPKSAGIVVTPESFEIAGAAIAIEVGYISNSFDSEE